LFVQVITELSWQKKPISWQPA